MHGHSLGLEGPGLREAREEIDRRRAQAPAPVTLRYLSVAMGEGRWATGHGTPSVRRAGLYGKKGGRGDPRPLSAHYPLYHAKKTPRLGVPSPPPPPPPRDKAPSQKCLEFWGDRTTAPPPTSDGRACTKDTLTEPKRHYYQTKIITDILPTPPRPPPCKHPNQQTNYFLFQNK